MLNQSQQKIFVQKLAILIINLKNKITLVILLSKSGQYKIINRYLKKKDLD